MEKNTRVLDYTKEVFDKVVALSKRKGFYYPSADIYGGMNGVWDKGHLGCILARNIENFWLEFMEQKCEYPLLRLDGAILGSHAMWNASGHVSNFHDPLVDCLDCQVRYRADDISLDKCCPRCGKMHWSQVRQFNMMFKTNLGPVENNDQYCYLRPETAQTIFVQFKNIMNTNRVKIPFGVTQIGKAFRNEITPKQFIFRSREFSQMEMEFFVHPSEGWHFYNYWIKLRKEFYEALQITKERIRITPHKDEDLSHYSKGTSDVEFYYPFGWKELEGIAYRTDFDLGSHAKYSGKNLSIHDEKTASSYIPHVVETSVGVERLMLVLLCDSYREEIENDDTRIYLSLPFKIAPYQISVLPLSKQEIELAEKIHNELKKQYRVTFDDNGSIGKRYRRQDEIGTPFCITVDETSLLDSTVTIRLRDTKEQIRMKWQELHTFFAKQ
jgi:glycyl-tRNA synthetase